MKNQEILSEVESALLEVEQILSRHDGIHTLHGIFCSIKCNKALLNRGIWEDSLEVYFRENLVRARVIDQTGFDPKSRRN